MRRISTLMVAGVLAMVPALAAFAQEDTASVSVLHGIPGDGGFPVDVYANGDYSAPLLDDFTFETLAGPLDLPAGTYSLEIYPGDTEDPAAVDPALGPVEVSVEAGGSYTIAAHLTADGTPTLTALANDTSAIAAGEARVGVRHLAAAPPVDVLLADGTVLFDALANPNQATADVPAGTYTVDVAADADNSVVVLDDAALDLAAGSFTIVHAIGDLEGGSFTVVPQVITGLGEAPAGVPTGNSGLAADGFPWAAAAVTALAALAVAGSGVALVHSRR